LPLNSGERRCLQMQVVTLLFWQCARGGRNLFASPDANAKGGMLYDAE